MTVTAETTEREAAGFATAYADVEPLEADWLLRDRIPKSELTILAALGGTGKGMLCCDLAARISRGITLPGDDEAEPAGNVILVSTEDDPNVVTVNRLHAAGADMARVFDLSTVNGAPFELPLHANVLRQAIEEIGNVRLVVLDPLAGVAPVSLTSVAKVRGILAPLRQIAHDTGCAIVITHHLTKGKEIAGSRAIIDGVRSVLTIDRDKVNPDNRIVRVAKSNMGTQPEDIWYTITDGPDGACVSYATNASEAPLSGQERILKALKDAPGTMTGQDLAAAAGMVYGAARPDFARLIAAGKIASPGRGVFADLSRGVATNVTAPMTGAERMANHRERTAA
jgi:putative DNA primase/helicase